MRCVGRLALIVFLSILALPANARAGENQAPNAESIAALQAKIDDAQPRERCFLYARLIHQMTEFSLMQHASGDVERTNALLEQVQALAHKLHLTVHEDDKRLKNAEILLRRTAFKLNELLHASSFEDRPLVEQTLAQVNQADDATIKQLFMK